MFVLVTNYCNQNKGPNSVWNKSMSSVKLQLFQFFHSVQKLTEFQQEAEAAVNSQSAMF